MWHGRRYQKNWMIKRAQRRAKLITREKGSDEVSGRDLWDPPSPPNSEGFWSPLTLALLIIQSVPGGGNLH